MPSGVYKRTKPAWNKGLTKDTDERVRKNVEASRSTVQQRYGVDSVFQIPEVQAEKEANKDQIYKKVADTKLQRYGDSHYNNMEKNRQTKLNNHGDANYNNPEKYKETSLLKYGYEHPNQNPEQKEKIRHSRQVNNSNEKAKQTIIAKYGSLNDLTEEEFKEKYGHKPIILVGGATCAIGDPSGKTQERKAISMEDVFHNVECVKTQISK